MAENKTALITGAGSGVGLATAVALAEAGWNLVLAGRTQAKLDLAADAARAVAAPRANGRVLTVAANLVTQDACRGVVGAALSEFGRLDAIAHVAGTAQVCPIEKITQEEWRRTLDINLSCAMYLTAAAWPAFARQKSGVIVNVSSLASIDPFPGFAMYAPTKAALNMFTRITANEGKSLGIRAVAIAPGAIETPLLRQFFSREMIPTEKCLKPEEVAQVIRDCITGARAFTSGEVIPMPSP